MLRALACAAIGLFAALFLPQASAVQAAETEEEARNRALAAGFYEDLWFSNNTDRYERYLADTYVVHDIGDRKNVVEPAIEQKHIADMFWSHGDMSGEIVYQIAEGDLVATRWIWRYEANTPFGHLLGSGEIPIINVFRFEDGRIVEIWNHRHDIDTGMARLLTLQGLGLGLLVALIPLIWALLLRRRVRRLEAG